MKQHIQFKKQRELGEILSDLFSFLRQEWKPLFTIIFKIAGPALLIVLVAYIYYMQSTLGSFGSPNFIGSNNFSLGNFIIPLLLLMIAGITYNALLYGTVIHYIKSYIKNEGKVIKEEVSFGAKNNFWSLIGLNFLMALMIGFGMLLCFFPGIYLAVVLSTVFCILIFEDRDIMDSISHSFTLIKENWWITFATFLVLGLIYYLVVLFFQVPQYIYFFISAFTKTQETSPDPANMFDWGYIAISTIGIIAQYLLLTMMVIGTVFVYFNLNEKKNFTGTLETIDSLGKRE
ncbi:MAG: hypothetical protein ACWA45_00610 [Flavobacteriales bacterium]